MGRKGGEDGGSIRLLTCFPRTRRAEKHIKGMKKTPTVKVFGFFSSSTV